ncbi:DNA kinase/phosphatase Pnk1 [Pseudogymnoascus australis]
MISWEVVEGTLLVARYTPEGSHDEIQKSSLNETRVAAFDLDSTIIDTKSGIIPNSDPEDWKWWHDNVVRKIRDVYLDGHQLIIFTNQGNLTTPTGELGPGLESFKRKIEDITQALSVPLIVYTACANDIYRKPRPGMWEEMQKALGGAVNLENSYFVGDAAGREKDYSDCDRHLSMNLGVRFYTPEEYFQGVISQVLGHRFNPNWLITPDIEVRMNKNPTKLEIHELGTMENCMKKAEHYLKKGFGVVIDDCNLDKPSRATWIDMARRLNVPVLAAEFTASSDLCLHNDSAGPKGQQIFPRTKFRELEKWLEVPTIEEGFSEIVKIGFEWIGTRSELEIWRRHWI